MKGSLMAGDDTWAPYWSAPGTVRAAGCRAYLPAAPGLRQPYSPWYPPGTPHDRPAAVRDLHLRHVDHPGAQQCDADRLGSELRFPAHAAAYLRCRGRIRGAAARGMRGPERTVRPLAGVAGRARLGGRGVPAVSRLADARSERHRGARQPPAGDLAPGRAVPVPQPQGVGDDGDRGDAVSAPGARTA